MGLGLQKERVHLSMPNYMKKTLHQFQHACRCKKNTPYPCALIQYGAKTQYVTTTSTAPAVETNHPTSL
jgi:hypothetical protein